MSNVEKMSIALTSDLAGVVKDAVRSGDYASTSEVVRDALREWKSRREQQAREAEVLRELWVQGLASGAPRPSSIADIKAAARGPAKRSRD